MSYNYTDGDGVDTLDSATPNGATEPVSNLDDAIKQIKKFLKDPIAGVKMLMTNAVPATAIVTLGTAQAFASGDPYATVKYDTIARDTSSAFDPVTWSFTVPVDASGLYHVDASLELDVTATTSPTLVTHKLAVFIDGIEAATTKLQVASDDTGKQIQVNRQFQLNAGQVITIRYQLAVATNSLSVQGVVSSLTSLFQITRLHQ